MSGSHSEGELEDDDISDSQHDDEIIDSGDEMEVDVKDDSDKKENKKDPPTGATGSTSSMYFDAAATEESSSSLPAATATQASEEQETPKANNKTSQSQQRKAWIDQELHSLFQRTEANELEEGDSMDPEITQALRKAAYKICYRKKYYDAVQDSFSTFPSVAKTIMNATLFEAAQEFCTSEDYREEGLPLLYTAALRATASDLLGEAGDDENDTSLRDRMATTVHSTSVSSKQQSLAGDSIPKESQRTSASFAESSGSDDKRGAPEPTGTTPMPQAPDVLHPEVLLLGSMESSQKGGEDDNDDELLFVDRSSSVSKSNEQKLAPSDISKVEGKKSSPSEIPPFETPDIEKVPKPGRDDASAEYLEITMHSTGDKHSYAADDEGQGELDEATNHTAGVYIYTKNEDCVNEDITFHSSSVREVAAFEAGEIIEEEEFVDAEEADEDASSERTGSLGLSSSASPIDAMVPDAMKVDENVLQVDAPSEQAENVTAKPEYEMHDEIDDIVAAAEAAAEEAKLLQQKQDKRQKGGGFMGGLFKGLRGSNSNIAAPIEPPFQLNESGANVADYQENATKLNSPILDVGIQATGTAGSTRDNENEGKDIPMTIDIGYVSEATMNIRAPEDMTENPTGLGADRDVSKSNDTVDAPVQLMNRAEIHRIATNGVAESSTEIFTSGASSDANGLEFLESNQEDRMAVQRHDAVGTVASTKMDPVSTGQEQTSASQIKNEESSSSPLRMGSESPTVGGKGIKSSTQQTADKAPEESGGALDALRAILLPGHPSTQDIANRRNESRSTPSVPAHSSHLSASDTLELERLEALLQTPPSPEDNPPTERKPKMKNQELSKLEEILLKSPPGREQGNCGPAESLNFHPIDNPTSSPGVGAASLARPANDEYGRMASPTVNDFWERMESLGRDIEEIKDTRKNLYSRSLHKAEETDSSPSHIGLDRDVQKMNALKTENDRLRDQVESLSTELEEVVDGLSQHIDASESAGDGSLDDHFGDSYVNLVANARKQLKDLENEMKELKNLNDSIDSGEESGNSSHLASEAKPRHLEPPVEDLQGTARNIELDAERSKKGSRRRSGKKKSNRKTGKDKQKRRQKPSEKENTERRSNRSIDVEDDDKGPVDPDDDEKSHRYDDPEGALQVLEKDRSTVSDTIPVQREKFSRPHDPPAIIEGVADSNGADTENQNKDPDGEKQVGDDESLTSNKLSRKAKRKSKAKTENTDVIDVSEIPEVEEEVEYIDYEEMLTGGPNPGYGVEDEGFSKASMDEGYVSRDLSINSVASYRMDRGCVSEEQEVFRQDTSDSRNRDSRKRRTSSDASEDNEWEGVPCSFCCKYLPHNMVVATSYAYGLHGGSNKSRDKRDETSARK
jgi:hypothetical protein